MKELLCAKVGSKKKTIRLINADMTTSDEVFDIVVCSAFKGDYAPVPHALIGSMRMNKGLDLRVLARSPEIDLRSFGGWLSAETGSDFKRIACVEILGLDDIYSMPGVGRSILNTDKILSQTFSTLGFLIRQAAFKGIPIRRIAMPILGAGNQGISVEYVVPPLLTECMSMLEDIDALEEICFFEINEAKAEQFRSIVSRTLAVSSKPDVFISYSTRNTDVALELAGILKENGISYWMAPDSIPTTSDYVKEISGALMSVSLLLLVMTREAEQSAWVPSEVSSAKGAKKVLLAFKPYEFEINDEFAFLFQRSQIYSAYSDSDYRRNLVDIIRKAINK